MTRSSKNPIKKIFSSRIFLFSVSFVLIILAVKLGQESYRKHQLTKEINNLKAEIERLEGRNQQLANLMDYLKEESYLEKEARIKLNLKKPGEKVVIVSRSEPAPSAEPAESAKPAKPAKPAGGGSVSERANWWKWWEYFFQ